MQTCTILKLTKDKRIIAYWSEYLEEKPEIYIYDNNADEEHFICEISLNDFKKIKYKDQINR